MKTDCALTSKLESRREESYWRESGDLSVGLFKGGEKVDLRHSDERRTRRGLTMTVSFEALTFVDLNLSHSPSFFFRLFTIVDY